jgi:hypothetical protein
MGTMIDEVMGVTVAESTTQAIGQHFLRVGRCVTAVGKLALQIVMIFFLLPFLPVVALAWMLHLHCSSHSDRESETPLATQLNSLHVEKR